MSQPAFHATLNGTAAVLLCLGWMAIRGVGPWRAGGRRPTTHRNLMLAAFGVSTVFLASYLEYHARVGSVEFQGTGALKTLYLFVLVPHIVLAAVMVPLILVTLNHAFRGRFDRHRIWARWTLPIWLYVSVTGVIVYLMLYVLAPVG